MFRKKKLLAGIILMTALYILAPVTGAKAEDNTYTDNNTYTVTIPAEVTIPEDTHTSEIPIKIKLTSNTNLVINVNSENDFNLINEKSNSDNGKIGYSISDRESLVFSNSTNSVTETIYKLKATLTKKTILYSGTYTDKLTFTMTSYPHELDSTNYQLKFDVNAGSDNDNVAITTTDKVLKADEKYGTLPTPVRTGYTFDGWYTTAENQTDEDLVTEENVMGSENVTLYAKWTIHEFKNTATFWAWGLKNGEGNNGPGTALRIAQNHTISDAVAYGNVYTFTIKMASEDLKINIPNGYELKQFGSATISDEKWTRYDFNDSGVFTGIQPDWVVNAEYEYDPINYTITYELDGGTNSTSNPATYTVLYGVTFADPTKEGYTFAGWYIKDEKVTGINENCINDFKDAPCYSDEEYNEAAKKFYEALENRTVGDITVTAKWTKNSDASNTDSENIAAESNTFDEEQITE